MLAQHLDPNRPSLLDGILRRRTNLAVEVVKERSQLQAGTIYMVETNRHDIINAGAIEVQGDHLPRPRPSVDLLFASSARVYGDRLIAVILTGSGSDGAAGAVEVKNAGGTVIVQNPHSARYPSMPLALPPTVVDFDVDVERIGPLLYDLLKGSKQQPEAKTEDMLREILEQVSRRASIDFRHYKTSTIFRRIGRRMAVTHSQTMHDYLDYLKTYPEETGELVKAFLINVTQFFRDPDAFAYLQREILPKLVARARDSDRILRFWTAGCATGEEPYSLAMLITMMLGAELPEWSVKIFATDLNEAAINFARRGLYSANLLESMPKEYSERYFERADHGYRISKTLRQMIIFGQQDLSRSAPFPRIDLVLCRNVLIYFAPELQEFVLNQFAFSLSPGSYLFLGKAETVRPQQACYELVNKHWKVYRSIGGALPPGSRLNMVELNPPRREEYAVGHPLRAVDKLHIERDTPQPALEIEQLRRFNELLLRFLPLGVVVIDRAYHVLTANGTARRMLGLRDLAHEQDFLHAVRGIPYAEVRSAIDTVFRERSTITLPETELDINEGGNGRFVALSITHLQIDGGAPSLAAISVSDVTEQVQTHRQLEAVQAEQAQLMNELGTTNKRLNDVYKELLDANEDLQIANEELVLTHEELQATNEELETTNEELETTNDELRARTGELQELTGLFESERMQLAEMIELSPYYIMVLRGPKLLVEAFNPRYAGLLQGREVHNRPLETVCELFWESGMPIVRMAHATYQQDRAQTTGRIRSTVPSLHGEPEERYFVYNLVTSHDASGGVSGVIVYAVDETEQQAREIEEEQARIRLIFDNANVAAMALYDARTTRLLMASPRYRDILARSYNLDLQALIGRKWHDLAFGPAEEEADTLWSRVLESCAAVRLPELHWQPLPTSPASIWDWSLAPVVDREQATKVLFMLVSAVEMTEQVQAREELERLNRLREDFLNTASKELRAPLAVIVDNAERLQASTRQAQGEASQAARATVGILRQAQQLHNLIDEIAEMTCLRNGQFEPYDTQHVDIVALVQRAIEQHKRYSGHPITLEVGQGQLLCTCDEGRMEQVVRKLLDNATAHSASETAVNVRIQGSANDVVVAVYNAGASISTEQQAHIFERFYRVPSAEHAQAEGLGLGLYIASELVAQEGGRMWLESAPDEGGTLAFSLPLENA